MSLLPDVRALISSSTDSSESRNLMKQLTLLMKLPDHDPSLLGENRAVFLNMFDKLFAKPVTKFSLDPYRRFFQAISSEPTLANAEKHFHLLPKENRQVMETRIRTYLPMFMRQCKEDPTFAFKVKFDLCNYFNQSDVNILSGLISNLNKKDPWESYLENTIQSLNFILGLLGLKMYDKKEEHSRGVLDFTAFNQRCQYLDLEMIDDSKLRLICENPRQAVVNAYKEIIEYVFTALKLNINKETKTFILMMIDSSLNEVLKDLSGPLCPYVALRQVLSEPEWMVKMADYLNMVMRGDQQFMKDGDFMKYIFSLGMSILSMWGKEIMEGFDFLCKDVDSVWFGRKASKPKISSGPRSCPSHLHDLTVLHKDWSDYIAQKKTDLVRFNDLTKRMRMFDNLAMVGEEVELLNQIFDMFTEDANRVAKEKQEPCMKEQTLDALEEYLCKLQQASVYPTGEVKASPETKLEQLKALLQEMKDCPIDDRVKFEELAQKMKQFNSWTLTQEEDHVLDQIFDIYDKIKFAQKKEDTVEEKIFKKTLNALFGDQEKTLPSRLSAEDKETFKETVDNILGDPKKWEEELTKTMESLPDLLHKTLNKTIEKNKGGFGDLFKSFGVDPEKAVDQIFQGFGSKSTKERPKPVFLRVPTSSPVDSPAPVEAPDMDCPSTSETINPAFDHSKVDVPSGSGVSGIDGWDNIEDSQ